jgi:hypothetical protein
MDENKKVVPVVIVEGARKSGKSYLINSQGLFPVFKFDFNGAFEKLSLGHESESTHMFGLGKEIMLHQLIKNGFISGIMVDRGILTNSVWSIIMKRTSKTEVFKSLEYAIEEGYFENVVFLLVKGTYNGDRDKDLWDSMEHLIPEEVRIFNEVLDFVIKNGVKAYTIDNNFDPNSVNEFNSFLKSIK